MKSSIEQSLIGKAIILALALFLSLGALEITLRGVGYIPSYGDPTLFTFTNDRRQYGLAPGWTGVFAGASVRINQLGLRGTEIPPTKNTDEYRILILGDSVAFGQGVEAQETFAGLLEQSIQEARPNLMIKVINAGVPGYNTETEMAQLSTIWPIALPDLVILSYLIDNDSDSETGIRVDHATGQIDVGFYGPGLVSQASYFLHRHSRLYNFLKNRIRILIVSIGQHQYSHSQEFLSSQQAGWEASQHAILEIKNYCEQRNVPLIVGGLALVVRLQDMNRLASFVAERGVHYVELWKTENVAEYFTKYAISQVDGHPNVRAHRLVARRLTDSVLPFVPQVKQSVTRTDEYS